MSDTVWLMEALDAVDDGYLKPYFERKARSAEEARAGKRKNVIRWGAVAAAFVMVCVLAWVVRDRTNNRHGSYRVYSLGTSDGGGAGAQKQEYSLDFGTPFDYKRAPKEATASFMGASFSGEYFQSMSSDLYPHTLNAYMSPDKTVFWLDSKTGEFRYMTRLSVYGENNPPEQHLSQEECAVLADNLLKQMIEDDSEYTFISSSSFKYSDGKYSYDFDYCRMIGGLESKDVIRIGFYSTGELALYDIRTYGTLKGASLPSSYDEDKVTEAVRAKMEDVYAPRKDKITFDYTEKAREVVRLKDGSVGLYVPVEVAIYNSGSGSEPSYCEVVEFIIRLN